jgi:hypothetical protein
MTTTLTCVAPPGFRRQAAAALPEDESVGGLDARGKQAGEGLGGAEVDAHVAGLLLAAPGRALRFAHDLPLQKGRE